MSEDLSARLLVIESWVILGPITFFFVILIIMVFGYYTPDNFSPNTYLWVIYLTFLILGFTIASLWKLSVEFILEGRDGLKYLKNYWYVFPFINLFTIIFICIYELLSKIFINAKFVDLFSTKFEFYFYFSMFGILLLPVVLHVLFESYIAKYR